MPISPTFGCRLPLCKPFVNPLYFPEEVKEGEGVVMFRIDFRLLEQHVITEEEGRMCGCVYE